MGAQVNQAEQETLATSPEVVDSLLEAARYDDLDDIKSIASTGVSLDSKDSLGRTALHMAAANGHLGIVEYLISQGVDLNACNDEKNTPLHWASLNGRVEVVKKLILAGASLSILNSHERTAVDEAISQGKVDVVDAINAAVAQSELSGTTNVKRNSCMLQGDKTVNMQNPTTFLQRQQGRSQTSAQGRFAPPSNTIKSQAIFPPNPSPTPSSGIANGSRSILGYKYK